jgi:hypothetical protein
MRSGAAPFDSITTGASGVVATPPRAAGASV